MSLQNEIMLAKYENSRALIVALSGILPGKPRIPLRKAISLEQMHSPVLNSWQHISIFKVIKYYPILWLVEGIPSTTLTCCFEVAFIDLLSNLNCQTALYFIAFLISGSNNWLWVFNIIHDSQFITVSWWCLLLLCKLRRLLLLQTF